MTISSDKDILGKADGLMRRHATTADTSAVPVLTDLVEVGPSVPARGPHADLAREIFARVMAEVESRLAADLERRLAQHLIPQVHAAVASAIGDLHQELANAIGDAITRALEHRNIK
jgi:hypothetical protein